MFLRSASPDLRGNEKKYLIDAIDEEEISSQGRFVREFESSFADFCDARHAVSTSNGTTALHLALLAAGIKEGDEVIVPSLTFVATANAVKYVGATPVFADINTEYWGINTTHLEELISPKTTAIIPVHLYGHPANMDEIMEFAKRHQLIVLEDAAEAHGSLYRGKKVGAIGDLGIYSFYGNKIFSTGEGGMLVTNSDSIANKARLLRDHGVDPNKRFWHPVVGYNYRMTNLQAAVGVAQLERQECFLKARLEIANLYTERLRDAPQISFQIKQEWASPVCWLFSILLEPDAQSKRDILLKDLLEKNIECRPFFYPIHHLPPYKNNVDPLNKKLTNSEEISRRGLSLPTSTKMDASDISRVSDGILQFLSKN